MSELNIGVIVGSTRPGRVGDQVAAWVMQHAQAQAVTFSLLDLQHFALPNLDESVPAVLESMNSSTLRNGLQQLAHSMDLCL